MLEFLSELFGTTEDGKGEALTLEQIEAKIAAGGDKFNIVNIADGGYIAKEKFDKKDMELKAVKKQLGEANDTIKSYEDMDIDGIKKSVGEWQKKYEDETTELKQQLAAKETEFAARSYLAHFKFADPLAEEVIFGKFMEKKFARENDKFLGADDFMAEMKKDHPSFFVPDEPTPAPAPDPAPAPAPEPAQPKPYFAPTQPPAPSEKKRSLRELMKYHNEHPDEPIKFD